MPSVQTPFIRRWRVKVVTAPFLAGLTTFLTLLFPAAPGGVSARDKAINAAAGFEVSGSAADLPHRETIFWEGVRSTDENPSGVSGEYPGRHSETGTDQVQILADGAYYKVLMDHLRNAKERIIVGMFLFKTTTSRQNRPAMIAAELVRARKRGIVVKVVLEQSARESSINEENHRVARILEDGGVEVMFDSPETTAHQKIVVVDRRYTFIGSHNFTHSALYWNREFSLLIDSRTVAGKAEDYVLSLVPR